MPFKNSSLPICNPLGVCEREIEQERERELEREREQERDREIYI